MIFTHKQKKIGPKLKGKKPFLFIGCKILMWTIIWNINESWGKNGEYTRSFQG